MSIQSTMNALDSNGVIKQKHRESNVQGVPVTEPNYFITEK